jgi:hypothetical protein
MMGVFGRHNALLNIGQIAIQRSGDALLVLRRQSWFFDFKSCPVSALNAKISSLSYYLTIKYHHQQRHAYGTSKRRVRARTHQSVGPNDRCV